MALNSCGCICSDSFCKWSLLWVLNETDPAPSSTRAPLAGVELYVVRPASGVVSCYMGAVGAIGVDEKVGASVRGARLARDKISSAIVFMQKI